jgi:hypothetical protein
MLHYSNFGSREARRAAEPKPKSSWVDDLLCAVLAAVCAVVGLFFIAWWTVLPLLGLLWLVGWAK